MLHRWGLQSAVELDKPGSQAGSITISGLEATGIYRSALSAESWSDSPITNVVI